MAIEVPPSLNGRPRKQLSDQLDRLDEVINGMEECLPQAVAEAARDGIRQAFRDMLRELVADPAGLKNLQAVLMPDVVPMTTAPKPGAFTRLKTIVRNAAMTAATAVGMAKLATKLVGQHVAARITERCSAARARVARWTILALPLKSILGISLGIGLLATALCIMAPHHVAATISGFSTTACAMTLQVGHWLRRRTVPDLAR